MKKYFNVLLFFCATLALVSCSPDSPRSMRKLNAQNSLKPTPAPSPSTTTNLLETILSNGRTEITHVVNPYTGTFESKVTIPSNFNGTVYLSGINISNLASRLVYARLKFGQAREIVEVPVGIVRTSGIVPSMDIQVAALYFRGAPLSKIRLLYDLFDYNTYSATGTPTQDPKNKGLYCRGLKLADDPTFQGTLSNPLCDASGERCLYTYAKIGDSTLVKNEISFQPTLPQIDQTGKGYVVEVGDHIVGVKKCLPDSNDLSSFNAVTGSNLTGSLAYDIPVWNDYVYRGPYRVFNREGWEVTKGALISSSANPTGLFEATLSPDPLFPERGGYKSFLFPRAYKMKLKSGVEHFSSPDPFTPRTLTALSTSGDTGHMDGCNARLVNPSDYDPQSLSACNLTASIELYTRDADTNAEMILASTKEAKIQIVRASQTDSYGVEVINSSMNTCQNSSGCGADQCCYNNRCWPKTYVSQCREDFTTVGNLPVGGACKNDYECASLCCSQASCQPHGTNLSTPAYCSKSVGETCIAREWCSKVEVLTPLVVKIKGAAVGEAQCQLITYKMQLFADCVNGTCKNPVAPQAPAFDPSKASDPNYCTGLGAQDAPDMPSI